MGAVSPTFSFDGEGKESYFPDTAAYTTHLPIQWIRLTHNVQYTIGEKGTFFFTIK